MKLVAGRSLRDLLAERPTIEQRIALLHHVIAVADTLAYAHGRRIIHRDLKPANVIVGDFGETIVIDWGLAKELSATDEGSVTSSASSRTTRDDELTSAGSVMGTPAYMAPEQHRGGLVDQRADVFAIGAMLWELCVPPTVAAPTTAERHRLLLRAGIDPDLAAIVDKALDPDPARRYPDAGALAADLKAFKAGARIAARRYSLLAILGHWTRRHRRLALAAAAALALALVASVAFVRNITAERDRADHERDRARLSEASALLDKDPARAKDLLASLSLRSPQYALLTSRARQRAATLVVPGLTGVAGLFRAPGTSDIALLTLDGELHRLDPRTGARQLLDRDVAVAVTHHAGEWLYARKPFGATTVTFSTPSKARAFEAGSLTGIAGLASVGDAVYALDTSHDLYRLGSDAPALVRHAVHRIAAAGRLLLVCSVDGTLEALRDGAVVLHRRCPQIVSPETFAVAGDDHASVTEPGILTAVRAGQTADIPLALPGEHEVALSRAGVIAIADYERGGAAWFVAADAVTPQPGPVHASTLVSVAAGGNLAVWGYTDGSVVAIDTTTGATWELKGHPGGATHIVVDDDGRRLISTSTQELRVWDLEPPPATRISSIPCNAYRIQLSPDGTQAALDCRGGSVLVWSRRSGAVTQLHRHTGHAFGVQWLGDLVCSGGWDGVVLCSTTDGKLDRTFTPDAGRILSLAASPGADFLVLASADGRIWKLDDRLQPLYSQDARPVLVAVAPGQTLVASCGTDGSLIVFDLATSRVVSRVVAHTGPTRSCAWQGDAIWTSGVDGRLRQWTLHRGTLELRAQVLDPAPLRFTKVFSGGWAASAGETTLVIGGADPTTPPLRLALDKPIYAIDVSPDARYVAASIPGEIVIVDLRDDKLATMDIDSSTTGQAAFVDARSLAVTAATGLKLVHIDQLDYIPF